MTVACLELIIQIILLVAGLYIESNNPFLNQVSTARETVDYSAACKFNAIKKVLQMPNK